MCFSLGNETKDGSMMSKTMDLKEQISHLENKLLDNEVRLNTAELEQLLAPGFFEFGSSGNVFYRDERLGEGGVGIRELSLYNFAIKQLAENVVLATYITKDTKRKNEALRSSIWKFHNNRWQMVFHQGTIKK